MVEGARLEILCTPCGYRGFKSLPLRQFMIKGKLPIGGFFLVKRSDNPHAECVNTTYRLHLAHVFYRKDANGDKQPSESKSNATGN